MLPGNLKLSPRRFNHPAQIPNGNSAGRSSPPPGEGVVAELSGQEMGDISHSIVQMGIRAAICVPIMLGGAIAAYLYLDSRGAMSQQSRPGAAAFCLALGRMSGLALANLKRVEMEKRQAAIEFDLSAAAKAQQWILPKRVTQSGRLTCIGESRPGQFLGGDFFDIIPLDEHRTALALGDVSGHGVAASVVMTAAPGLSARITEKQSERFRCGDEPEPFSLPPLPSTEFRHTMGWYF